MGQRPYDIYTVLGRTVVQYDLVNVRTTAFVVEDGRIMMRDSPLLPIILQASLSEQDRGELDRAANACEEITLTASSGTPFVTAPHQAPKRFLKEAKEYLFP